MKKEFQQAWEFSGNFLISGNSMPHSVDVQDFWDIFVNFYTFSGNVLKIHSHAWVWYFWLFLHSIQTNCQHVLTNTCFILLSWCRCYFIIGTWVVYMRLSLTNQVHNGSVKPSYIKIQEKTKAFSRGNNITSKN